MNLKQIIHKQKTQKFDLASLVRNTEETLYESSTGSLSGTAVASSSWAKIKSLYESEEYDKLLRSKIIDKDGQKVQVGTAIDYSYKSGQMTDSEKEAYRQAIAAIGDAVAKGDIEAEDIPDNEKEVLDRARKQSTATAAEPTQTTQDRTKDVDKELGDFLGSDDDDKEGKSDDSKDVVSKPEATEEDIETAQENIENAGEPNTKDKSLSDVDENVFSATIPPAVTDKQFKQNMKAAKSKNIEPPFSFTDEQKEKLFNKVPAVYSTVIERMLNQTKGKSTVTDFMEGVGAGQPSSQAGEIITMAAIAMDDESANEFFNMLRERVKDSNYPKDSWIDKSWVDSAQQVRNGTIARYNGTYGEGNWEIEKGCWDSKTEVEAMGLSDYKKNKGFSTDTYMRIKVDGQSQLDEISLKKDLSVNFLNKNTAALVDFAILGSDDAGLYTELNDLWSEIPTNKRNNNKITYDVDGEQITAREIQSKINDMRSKAFSKLSESNPELAEQIKLADSDNAKVKQRSLLGDSISDKDNLVSMREAAKDFEKLKDEEPLNGILNSLVGGGQSRKAIEDFAKNAVELLLDGDKLDGITFGKDENGDALDPMVVYKNGEELKTKDQKEAIFGKGNSGSDRIQKIAWYATVVGSPKSKSLNKQRERIEENITQHTNAVMSTINDIPQMREGMLNAIREEFPLKALFEGEEKMSLAQYNCDPNVLKEIFSGAESYEEIQDKLGVEEDDSGQLSLVYKAEAGGKSIPVAQLEARSDGKGYGNSFKFTLKVHRQFQDALKEGNKAAYPQSGVYEVSIKLGDILSEEKINTLAYHWKIAEDDYPVDLFIKELNERSLN